MESGQTPILVWWDYLLASEVGAKYKNLKIVIPTDANYAAYYDQAISKYAPHPAAARLWEEYLYSTEGQNLFLEGGTRPIELPTLVERGHRGQDGLRRAAAGPGRRDHLPEHRAAEHGGDRRRAAVADRHRLTDG